MAQNTPAWRKKRVFINIIDTYSSHNIAKYLWSRPLEEDEEQEEEEDNEGDDDKVELEENQRAFEIVGTSSANSEGKTEKFMTEVYTSLEREELLTHLRKCDVVIYNISEVKEQVEEASWAVSALHAELDDLAHPMVFILASSVMTWALTKLPDPNDPELPITDEIFLKRRNHPNFKDHSTAEKLVTKLGKTKKSRFSTYVVASGLQYGLGENIFHYFFKMAWLGEVTEIPVFGDGGNKIPSIHVRDLAGVIHNIIIQKPRRHYLVAVDDSMNTLEDMVKVISSALGPGKTKQVPQEDAFLTKDLTQEQVDSLLVNLYIDAAYLKEDFSIKWVCQSGLVDNIHMVVEEFRKTRGFLPIRICILGPPAVGKSRISEKICAHYKLHHVTVRDAINERIAYLEDSLKEEFSEDEEEQEETDTNARELLDALQESIAENGGLPEKQFIVDIMKDKLKSNPCKNQGFVIDGFPETYEEAQDFFASEDDDVESNTMTPKFNKHITPEFVFSLEACDEFLKERVLNLPESVVQALDYSQEQFLSRLTSYREKNVIDETVLNYFDENEVDLLQIDVSAVEETIVMEKIIKAVGKARNYGPSLEEIQEVERKEAEEQQNRLEAEQKEAEKRQAEEAEARAERWMKWKHDLEQVKEQEKELLEAQTLPLRNYLMANVMPILSKGLIECCRLKPDDPLDFLAEYLIRNNPEGDQK